ncbi:MAG TPA: hypothetical protein VMM18_18150 [Gemmatimonadaceae bacterium]|nr:hypothetical protein [Gemmatimonadaceae bacterium]
MQRRAVGRDRATVVLPLRLENEPTPLITHDAVVGVVIDPDTDLQSLVALRIAARAR